MLAHVRSAFALSNGTYGSPRMTRELQDDGFAIGHRRTARPMRENGLRGRLKLARQAALRALLHQPSAVRRNRVTLSTCVSN
jgi:hypothetical protein